MAKTMTKKKADGASAPSFEAGLTRLEKIVELLDDGNLPLDESLALFKEGTRLAKSCRDLLAAAEVQVKQALAEADAGGDEDDEDDDSDADGAGDDDLDDDVDEDADDDTDDDDTETM